MNTLKKLLEFNISQRGRGSVLHPCLIARSGAGKSSTVEELLKEFKEYKLHTLLLQTMLEYEVIGIPQAKDGIVEFSVASWIKKAVENPSIIFIDEVDKPRQEVVSSILTLLSSFKINSWKLHPETIFVLAGQEAPNDDSLTLEALRRRMILIPKSFWYKENYLSSKYNIDMAWYQYSPRVENNLIYPSPREVDYLINLYFSSILTEEEYKMLLSENYKKDFVEEFTKSLTRNNIAQVSPELLVDKLNAEPLKIKKLKIDDILLISSYANKISTKVFALMLVFYQAMTVEQKEEFLKNVYDNMTHTEEFLLEQDDEAVSKILVTSGNAVFLYICNKNNLDTKSLLAGTYDLKWLPTLKDLDEMIDVAWEAIKDMEV